MSRTLHNLPKQFMCLSNCSNRMSRVGSLLFKVNGKKFDRMAGELHVAIWAQAGTKEFL